MEEKHISLPFPYNRSILSVNKKILLLPKIRKIELDLGRGGFLLLFFCINSALTRNKGMDELCKVFSPPALSLRSRFLLFDNDDESVIVISSGP